MRAVILAVVCGLALATTSLQAAPVPTKTLPGELGTVPPVELVRDGCVRGWHRHHWRDQWAIGDGVTAFRTGVVLTAALARDGTIHPPFGAARLHHGAGVGNPSQATRAPNPSLAEDPERLTLRQADQVPTRTPL